MKTIPYIDIVEKERIREIVANPKNFVFSAFACETLDGWVPDIGLTGDYPERSVYRPPSVSKAGIASSIRHRFWSSVEGKTDHTGWRYIGILLHDAAEEASALEVRLGADDVGRIELSRRNNQRHLLVLDQPAHFIGGMEVFQVNTHGHGTHRIESFVLMPERPEASSYVPHIRRLSSYITRRSEESVDVRVDFITTEVATSQVEALSEQESGTPHLSKNDRLTKSHRLLLTDLRPDRQYTLKVTATEKLGTRASETMALFTGEQKRRNDQSTSIPIEIVNIAQENVGAVPITFGIPLPQSHLFDAPAGQLRVGSLEQPLQTRIHSRWPDGSARWLLIDSVSHPLLASECKQAEIILGQNMTSQTDGLTWEVESNRVGVSNQQLRVSVQGGKVDQALQIEQRNSKGEWQIVTADLAVNIRLGNDFELKLGPIEDLILEEAGSERAVIRFRMPHCDSAGVTHLRSTFRLHVYRQHPFVKIIHRLEVISPALSPACGGTSADLPPGYDEISSAIFGMEREETSLLTLKSVALHLSRPGNTQVELDGQVYPVDVSSGWELTHPHDLVHTIRSNGTAHTHDGRTHGHVVVNGENNPIAIGIRNFWETYPRGIHIIRDRISLQLMPLLSAEPFPGDEDAPHRIYFWRDAEKYKVKVGMSFTSEILVAFPQPSDNTAHWFAWFEQPAAVRPALDWLNETRVLSPIAAKLNSLSPQYETMTDDAYFEWLRDRDHWRQYGFMNFGDWYGEGAWCWGNNEYDAPYTHYLEFLRGGNPGWYLLAGQAATHLADIDTINYSSNRSEIGGQHMHMPGHAGGFLPPYFRSKIKGSTLIPSHMWAEGPALHYSLTGDENLRESLDRTAEWLVSGGLKNFSGGLDNYDFANCRECGWHIIHLTGIARSSDDPRYLNAAAIIVEKVLERQEPGGGWVRLLSESHCGCPPPRHRGEAGFMVGVLLSGLRRFHELTDDPRVADAIVGGVRWLIDNTYEPDKGHFRYTPCPNRGSGASPFLTLMVIEGLAYAYKLSSDPVMGEILKNGLTALGSPRKAPDTMYHTGFGKDVCMETRYVPTLLEYVRTLDDVE